MFNIGIGASSSLTTRIGYYNAAKIWPNDFYWDSSRGIAYKLFERGYASISEVVTDVHANPHLIETANGSVSVVGTNVVSQTGLGLHALPTATNIIASNNYSPSSVSGLSGYRNTVVSVVAKASLPQAVRDALTSFDVHNTITAVYKVVTPSENDSGVNFSGSIAANGTASVSAFVYLESTEAGNGVGLCLSNNNVGLDNTANNRAVLGSWVRLKNENLTNGGNATSGLRIRNTAVAGACTYYFILQQVETGKFCTPPITSTGSATTRQGNIVNLALPIQAQQGVGGFINVDIRGSRIEDLPVLLGFNPSVKLSQSLMDVGYDIGDNSTGVKTIVFASSPGYTKLRIVGQPDTTAVTTGSFEDDIVSMSLGGNGFDNTQNMYALFKKISLSFGPMNDTKFNTLYSQAS